jgi:hypothetical protein
LFTAAFPRTGGAADDPRWQVNLSAFVSDGRYGTELDTRLAYTTLGIRRTFGRGDLTVVASFLDVASDGSVLVFQGQVQPARRGDRRPPPAPVLQKETTQASGPGDVAILGRYFLHEDRGGWPTVDATARVELPTGDEGRGLGLGAPTLELGFEVSKGFGRSLVGLADASFTLVREPEGVDVRNTWEISVGLGWYPTEPLLLTLAYEEWRPVTPAAPLGRDLLGTASLKAGRSLRLFASAQFPLSEEAPDFGLGAGIGVRF